MNNLLNIIVCLSIFLTTSLNSVVIAQTTTEKINVTTATSEGTTLASNNNDKEGAVREDGSDYTERPFAPDHN